MFGCRGAFSPHCHIANVAIQNTSVDGCCHGSIGEEKGWVDHVILKVFEDSSHEQNELIPCVVQYKI